MISKKGGDVEDDVESEEKSEDGETDAAKRIRYDMIFGYG